MHGESGPGHIQKPSTALASAPHPHPPPRVLPANPHAAPRERLCRGPIREARVSAPTLHNRAAASAFRLQAKPEDQMRQRLPWCRIAHTNLRSLAPCLRRDPPADPFLSFPQNACVQRAVCYWKMKSVRLSFWALPLVALVGPPPPTLLAFRVANLQHLGNCASRVS